MFVCLPEIATWLIDCFMYHARLRRTRIVKTKIKMKEYKQNKRLAATVCKHDGSKGRNYNEECWCWSACSCNNSNKIKMKIIRLASSPIYHWLIKAYFFFIQIRVDFISSQAQLSSTKASSCNLSLSVATGTGNNDTEEVQKRWMYKYSTHLCCVWYLLP